MLKQIDNMMLFGQAAFSCGLLNVLLPAFTATCNAGFIWIVTGLALLLDKRTRRQGWMVLFALALVYLFGNLILKEAVMRERPFVQLGIQNLLIPPPHGSSFPSGHSAASFAALTVLFAANPKARIPAAVYALLIAWSRAYLFVHYPSDVLAGALLGVACGYLVLAVFRRFRAPRRPGQPIETTW